MRVDNNSALIAIMQTIKEQGASEAVLIDIADIVIDERVRFKCQIPVCDSYNKNLMCPPYVPTVEEFRKVLSLYSRGILLRVSGEVREIAAGKPSDEVFSYAKKLHELVHFAEREAFFAGFRFAAGLIGGCCRLCDECVAVSSGNTCRFPFKARPSMEAMGIDVVATTKNAGLDVSFPVEGNVTWIGLILI